MKFGGHPSCARVARCCSASFSEAQIFLQNLCNTKKNPIFKATYLKDRGRDGKKKYDEPNFHGV